MWGCTVSLQKHPYGGLAKAVSLCLYIPFSAHGDVALDGAALLHGDGGSLDVAGDAGGLAQRHIAGALHIAVDNTAADQRAHHQVAGDDRALADGHSVADGGVALHGLAVQLQLLGGDVAVVIRTEQHRAGADDVALELAADLHVAVGLQRAGQLRAGCDIGGGHRRGGLHGFRRGDDRRGLLRRGMLPVLLGGHAGGGHDLLVLTDLDAEQLVGDAVEDVALFQSTHLCHADLPLSSCSSAALCR